MKKVTTVLSVVNRLPYLNSQLDSINNQTIDSDIFIIWRNKERYSLSYPCIIYQNETQHFNSLYGRFYNSLHIKTPYVFIVDDDILPGKKYIERCIEFSKKENDKVVICHYGVIVDRNNINYYTAEKVKPDTFLEIPTQVNMGGQGWFLKTELLNHFLDEYIVDESTGEDLHFSFSLANKNIPIFILDKDKNDKDTWQDLTLGERGGDDYSQWKNNPTHFETRDFLLKAYAEKGWNFSRDRTKKYKNRLV